MNKLKNRDNCLLKRALSIKEASQFLCVSRGTLENWMARGILPYEEYPGRGPGGRRFKRIRLEDLRNFIKINYNGSHQPSKTKNVILLPANHSEINDSC